MGSGGHPSLLCCAVIRRPSGSSGLSELYVPLIIHLGCGALGQAHKELIYSLSGNERSWRCWAGSGGRWPCCQEIDLMDGLQRRSTPTASPPAQRGASFSRPTHTSASTHLALISLFIWPLSRSGNTPLFHPPACLSVYTPSFNTAVLICILQRHALKHL